MKGEQLERDTTIKDRKYSSIEAAATTSDTHNTFVVMPRVKDALGYLEKVKRKFCDQPGVYNQFLEIMKEFKSQSINTEGVIQRVTTLFHGHRALILGFNQFLPPGYKIVEPAEPNVVESSFAGEALASAAAASAGSTSSIGNAPKPTVEFNHAVKYVAKIKQRFEAKPDVYEDFLEILHAYQEKRATSGAIEQVKAQVQHLFRGHPDLLDDFNYFLPPGSGGGWHLPKGKKNKGKKRKNLDKDRKMDRTKQFDPDSPRLGRRSSASTFSVSSFPNDAKKELQLFETIKSSVPKALYVQFLRCLNLYSCEIITRVELVTLCEDLFNTFPKFNELSSKFKDMIEYNEWNENQLMTQQRSNFYAFVSSVDFTTCRQVTPSYRELPREVPVPSCTGRTVLGDCVLNDTCISIPTGTEDQSFKSSRKNQYEEALFKVEDERYELDMMIENNAAAIRALQPICDTIKNMTRQQAAAFKFGDNIHVLHIRAMTRIYGDQWFDIVRLLRHNPASAVPVIMKRLRQKDEEWRKVRLAMKKPWRDIVNTNYHRSLDHRSFQFKAEEKKLLSSKSLVAELKDDHEKAFGMEREAAGQTAAPAGLEMLPAYRCTRTLYTYCMSYEYADVEVHRELHDLMRRIVDNMSPDDKIVSLGLWTGFVEHIFGIKNADDDSDVMLDDDNDDEDLRHCKPIRLMMEAWSELEKTHPVRQHTRPSRLFFGNISFYVFFRLHHFLFSRWKKCRDLALAKPNGKEVYDAFKVLVWRLLDNEIEQIDFEDSLRKLVGAGAYQMFTIDRLISHVLKQMQSLLANSTNQRIVSLYKHEFHRARNSVSKITLKHSAQLARNYLGNFIAFTATEGACMQMEYFEDSHELGIGLIDTFMLTESMNFPVEGKQYLSAFLETPIDAGGAHQDTILPSVLRRNIARGIARIPPDAHFTAQNGLQCKMCFRTFKMYFVEGTEDVLIRIRRNGSPPMIRSKARHAQKFLAWWNKQPSATPDQSMCVRFEAPYTATRSPTPPKKHASQFAMSLPSLLSGYSSGVSLEASAVSLAPPLATPITAASRIMDVDMNTTKLAMDIS